MTQRASPLLRLVVVPVTVEPRTASEVEVSGGKPHYLPAPALAGEAVLVRQAAMEHVRDSQDLPI
jgi:hypothetical protein